MNLLLMHYLLGDMCSLAKTVARSKYLATHLSGGGRREFQFTSIPTYRQSSTRLAVEPHRSRPCSQVLKEGVEAYVSTDQLDTLHLVQVDTAEDIRSQSLVPHSRESTQFFDEASSFIHQ